MLVLLGQPASREDGGRIWEWMFPQHCMVMRWGSRALLYSPNSSQVTCYVKVLHYVQATGAFKQFEVRHLTLFILLKELCGTSLAGFSLLLRALMSPETSWVQFKCPYRCGDQIVSNGERTYLERDEWCLPHGYE